MRKNKIIVLAAGAVFFLTAAAQACAPDFDNAYFVGSTKEKFLTIPEGNFLFELKRIAGDISPMTLPKEEQKRVTDSDINDLKSALNSLKIKGKDFEEAVASYQKARDEINAFLESCPVEDSSLWYGGRFRSHERVESNLTKGERDSLSVQLPQPKWWGIGDSAPEGFNKTDQRNYAEPHLIFSTNVPNEFKLYLNGALKYHFNDFEAAISEWKKILALPEKERKYKSTWASFMIGKAYLSMRKQKEAIPYFVKTRELSEKKYIDSLGLSLESYGWQALAEYELEDYVSSIQHYLKQLDVNSLNRLCTKVSEKKDNTMAKIIQDNVARSVLLGWAVSRPFWNAMEWGEDKTYKDFYNRLLVAVEGLKVSTPVDYADRVAWLYYIKGDAANAKRWLSLSRASTPLAQFIDFKLELRDGKVDAAIQKLTKVMSAFEKSRDQDIFFMEDVERMLNSDMAVLKLSRKEYLMAFEVLLKGKYWEDIAYVAEKVLTIQELEDFLKSNRYNELLSKKQKFYYGYYIYAKNTLKMHPEDSEWLLDAVKEDGPTLRESLEYLLARRLARQGDWERAIGHMPTKVQISFDKVTKDKDGVSNYERAYEDINPKEKVGELKNLLMDGQSEKIAKEKRARAYYDAAIIVRRYGMELMGTELDPDGFVDRGAFPCYGSIENRFGILSDEARADYEQWYKEEIERKAKLRLEIKSNRGFFYGTEDEEDRVMGSLPAPNKRFHYRYKAADLMWKSAQLLPDNDELKAKALCLGGTYLKIKDPKAADKFYKALVKTCGKTELGKAADKLKWFPKMEEK